ncbi:aminopeptidase P N-terminal domain-containing protein [Litorivicinus sp.]|nr:aminopeptidase P N-terminal domain-containing protein [Litorivicinus sp.]MDC1240166.1 aminopeptidase P N-terminal domain-containing protein [Litorivicinus sp.]
MLALNVYAERRSRIKALMPENSLAIVSAAREVIRNRDAEYPFRQSSDFWYLTGFTEPDAVLVFGPSQPDRLFVRPKNIEKEVWTGRRLGPDRVKMKLGIDEGYSLESFDAEFARLLPDVFWLEYPFNCLYSAELVDKALGAQMSHSRRHELLSHRVDLSRNLQLTRMIKSVEEMNVMREASRISARGHIEAMRTCEPGMTEDQLASIVEHSFRMQGSPSVAYQTIVAGGENACILHYIDRTGRLLSNDLVLIDAGCEIEGYAGDITRTLPVSGAFSGAQADIYDVVLGAQIDALSDMQVGMSIRSFHEAALRALTNGLIDLNIIDGPVEEALAEKRYRPYYMHGTGHFLGLDVHDVGIYEKNKEPIKLEAGMVITCEPGLYLSNRSAAPSPFRGIGVRIEDDVLITTAGPEVLTEEVPKTRTDIEALMRDA